MSNKLKVAALAAGALAFVGTAGTALATSPSKCAGAKIKAAGKLASCELGVYSKNAAKNTGTAGLSTCQAKYAAAFAKAQGGSDCLTSGDQAAIQAKVDAFASSENTGIDVTPPPSGKCQPALLKAAGKKASCKLGVYSKAAAKTPGAPDPTKLAGCTAKFTAAGTKATGDGDCAGAESPATIESDVDAFVTDANTELSVPPPSCCAAVNIVTVSTTGTLEVATLPAFPFPANVQTTIAVGGPDGDCKHTGTVPSFSVPVFCIPSLMFTSAVYPTGCAAGSDLGTAVVWDAASTNPQPDINRLGDTSDPDSNSCGTLGGGCNTSAGNAGADTKGNTNTTRGGNVNGITGKVHTAVDIPVHSLTWIAADASCPDTDGTFNPGTDTPVTDFTFILSPTTGHTSATFTDLNGDGCAKAGAGPLSKTADGVPANGPCCVVGQATTVSATAVAFTGGAPLYDLTFRSITPTTITACDPSSVGTCTLTTDACKD